MSFPQNYKNMDYEQYSKITGNYVAQVSQACDTTKYNRLGDIALAVHIDTQVYFYNSYFYRF